MAKKFGKFLVFTAVAGAIAAGAYYYFQNKDNPFSDDLDDDDFDDFSDDSEDSSSESDSTRSYVDLSLEKAEDTASTVLNEAKTTMEDAVSAADDAKTAVADTVKDAADTVESKVEEFFDDDDQ